MGLSDNEAKKFWPVFDADQEIKDLARRMLLYHPLPFSAVTSLSCEPIHKVQQRKQRVEYYHARPRIAHDPLDLLTHGRLEAMDGAPSASRFILPARTPVDALQCIVQQFPAFSAQHAVCSMTSATVQFNHATYGFLFPADAVSTDSQAALPFFGTRMAIGRHIIM